jgi:Domain of unknown function (DUF4157)
LKLDSTAKCTTCEDAEPRERASKPAKAPIAEGIEVSAAVDGALRATAQPLDAAARAWFEPRFGLDFSGVRIHHDSGADASARAVNALAFTVGRDIVFGDRQYAPHTSSGRLLLAHELVHVVQQGGTASADAPIFVQRQADPAATGAGGALATPAASTAADGRPLTPAERDVAAFVFGPALNLDPIRVKESSVVTAFGYIRTLPDIIYIPPGYSIPMKLLIHELTHCAQYQHGVSRLTTAAAAIEAKYDYGDEAGLLDAIKTKKCFDHFNTEQQAAIVEDYYLKVAAGGSTYPWSVFIDQVRAQGACIWPTTPTPAPEPAPKGSAQA